MSAAATNGIEFAKSFEFCQQAVEAGMRYTCIRSLTASETRRTITGLLAICLT